ncbi:MAG: hypothetical protein A2070_00950 [Bdellovibrionales bacterium GWC1_52_8]|nr:MAG: hypothetical protein A2Z97_04435 [Bdellovibrionales bacterium GWB1_52_6]OFZ02726.1 MAG: hypothetical protein A2X97_12350 [Bdellovibrionales bacterium GWA1_52_35]OFZ39744.1 MAG: hypothetical protein A2070_00950 [Bdellovibrionales bacterium GWC1_52_8]HCM41625.1 hypothetical protein [Bdellovibrionales bacterium]
MVDAPSGAALIRPSAGLTPVAPLLSFALPHSRSGRGPLSLRRCFPSSGSPVPVKEPSIKRENQTETKGDDMKTEIKEKLEQLAIKKSIPFCYSCYRQAPTGRCKTCGSDDLMREMPGVGCEWGTDWIIREILSTELTPVNTEEAFEESVRQCYPETVTVAWMEMDTVSVAKEMDPVSWNVAKAEWESQEADEGNIISFDHGSSYYWTSDLEAL